MVVNIIAYDDYNSKVPSDMCMEIVGAITTHIGSSAFRTGWKIIEVSDDPDSWKHNTDKASN